MLAMIPSSLLLSVTTHLTTDVAAIPRALADSDGAVSFDIHAGVARRQWLPHWMLVRYLPLVVIVLLFVMLSEAPQPMWLVMGVHLLAFFWLAMVCHGELSRTRPSSQHLTDFYLCLGVGGVLGGILNALVARLIFRGLYEFR